MYRYAVLYSAGSEGLPFVRAWESVHTDRLRL